MPQPQPTGTDVLSVLHTLSQLAPSPAALAETLTYLAPGSSVLLYQDAVAVASQARFAEVLSGYTLYVLEEDLKARGLSLELSATLVDYPRFVALTLQHDNVQAW